MRSAGCDLSSSRTSSSSPPRRRDLDRHPRQGRRQRPRSLSGRHCATADRRGGRGRRRRFRLAATGAPPAHKASARASTPYRRASSTMGERATSVRSSPAARRSSSRARTHMPRVTRGSRGSRPRFATTTRSPASTVGSCHTRTPDLPSSTSSTSSTGPTAGAAPRSRSRAQLRGDALLERELRSHAPHLGGIPVRGRHRDERGPGMVTPHPSRGTRDRVRARGCRLPLAHVLGRRCDAPVLRLGRVRGAIVRRRRGVQGGVVEGRRRLRAGRGCVALETGQRRWIPYAAVYEVAKFRASSSGDAIGFSPWRSSLGSARIPTHWTCVVRIRAEPGFGAKGSRQPSSPRRSSAFVVVVVTTLGQPLLERHAFRQTQTAYTARIFHEQGIDLIHPKMPVLGEPFEVPFEFPLFQAAASLVMDVGVRDDVAMRLTGLTCFLLTALLLYGLVRRVDGRVSGLPHSSPSSRRRSRSCGAARR